MSRYFFACLSVVILCTPTSWAQSNELDTPPNEPPYAEVSKELEDAPALDTQTATSNSISDAYSAPVDASSVGRLPKNTRKILHPAAADGLLKIDSDGTYLYKTPRLQGRNSGHIRFGTAQSPDIVAADGTTFSQMYKESEVFTFLFDYEGDMLVGSAGRLGWLAGFGFFTAQGNGRFAQTGQEAQEKYNFFAVPLNAGLIYKLENSDRQWIVPYALGGLSYYGLLEVRNDNKKYDAVGTAAAFGGGGLQFNITAVDREMAFNLQNEYGITNLWFSAEYRYVQSFSQDVDVSANIITGGISMDF
ncbi:MAG: hypothetical protein ACOYOK_11945 [Pseudobdellovibrionaceae bacterium]